MAQLKDRINQDLITAMKGGNNLVRDTLRMLAAAIKNTEIEKQGELTDEDLVTLLRKEVKTREESAEQYQKGGSAERAAKEREEIKIIETYLPAQMSDEEIDNIVTEAIKAAGATSMQEMGKVMKEVMSKVAGRSDGGTVSEIVRKHLT